MKLDINRVFINTDEYTDSCILKKEELELEDIILLEDVNIDIKLYKIDTEIYLNVKFRTKISIECVSCLNEAEKIIDDEFDVMYLSEREYLEYEESLKSDNEYDYKDTIKEVLEKNTYIDITKIVKEHIIVATPLYPKCSENCEGLEEKKIYEKENDIDPRWQQLLNIVKEN